VWRSRAGLRACGARRHACRSTPRAPARRPAGAGRSRGRRGRRARPGSPGERPGRPSSAERRRGRRGRRGTPGRQRGASSQAKANSSTVAPGSAGAARGVCVSACCRQGLGEALPLHHPQTHREGGTARRGAGGLPRGVSCGAPLRCGAEERRGGEGVRQAAPAPPTQSRRRGVPRAAQVEGSPGGARSDPPAPGASQDTLGFPAGGPGAVVGALRRLARPCPGPGRRTHAVGRTQPSNTQSSAQCSASSRWGAPMFRLSYLFLGMYVHSTTKLERAEHWNPPPTAGGTLGGTLGVRRPRSGQGARSAAAAPGAGSASSAGVRGRVCENCGCPRAGTPFCGGCGLPS